MKRKLIEVALPLEAINEEGQRDKSLNRRHPKSLHWWWARRPLAVCRAIVFAQLVDDPSAHPERFPTPEDQERERERLFALLRELVRWENSDDWALMKEAYQEIARCFDGEPPVVADPFCGGGSIPVEAQRLGLRTAASDLNPVAVLITKAMIELPVPFAGQPPVRPDGGEELMSRGDWRGYEGLAADVQYYGERLIEGARERVGHLFQGPPEVVGAGETPLAWIWARTVRCPNPVCGGTIPLVNNWWLSRPQKPSKRRPRTYLRPEPSTRGRWVACELAHDGEPPPGTVSGNDVVCPLCEGRTTVDYVKDEGSAGRMGAQLLAVAVEGRDGRRFRPADVEPSAAPSYGTPLSAETVPFHPQYLQLPRYGFTTFDTLFTPRQLELMRALVEALPGVRAQLEADGASSGYADVLQTYLAFLIDRIANRNSAFSFWNAVNHACEAATATNYLPMRWSFAEANPFADASGGALGQLKFLAEAVASLPVGPPGRALQLDATKAMPAPGPVAFCTDPPYFDNIPFSDLSDFYYVWLKRTARDVYPDLFSTILTPKERELVADATRHGDGESAADFFRRGLRAAFDLMAKATHPDVPIVVYYALRQRESTDEGGVVSTGWERMLQGLVEAGLAITSTWPVRTEKRGGLRSHRRSALASSVVISCRPRAADAPIATLGEFQAKLRAELPAAIRTLQHGGISAVDLHQAAIGPGMAVFSRYARVVGADGRPVPVRKALELINKALDEILAEQEAELDAETRFAVSWFSEFGTDWGPFGRAEDLARARNVAVEGLVGAGIAASNPGRVRLLKASELPEDWDPAADPRLTVWEITQHLIRRLETGGERAAADLLRRVGALGDVARDLAYRLYVICERKGWAQEALAYNALVVSWPEIARLAAGEADRPQPTLLEE